MVRRSKGRGLDQGVAGVEQSRDRVDPRYLERLRLRQRREDPREAPRQHRLARPRRAREQQVVRSRCGELERTPRPFLPAHLSQVGQRTRPRPVPLLGLGRLQLAAQVRHRLGEMGDRYRLDPRERRLDGRLRRTQDPSQPGGAGALGDREHAAHRPQPSIQRELADSGVAVELLDRHLPGRSQQRERDRQVERRPLFLQARRGEIDGDLALRPVALGGANAAPDAVLRLLARAIGEPDDREARDLADGLGLDLDAARLEPDQRMRDHSCEHVARLGNTE